MVAWLRVSRGVAPPAPTRPQSQYPPQPARAAEELVGVLASMALGALARG
jgi:hypothetical protein